MIKEKKKEFFLNKNVEDLKNLKSLRSHIIIYSNLLTNIWERGNFAVYGRVETGTTRIFYNENRIYQSSRYYDNSKELWSEVQKNLKENNLTIDILLQNLVDKYWIKQK